MKKEDLEKKINFLYKPLKKLGQYGTIFIASYMISKATVPVMLDGAYYLQNNEIVAFPDSTSEKLKKYKFHRLVDKSGDYLNQGFIDEYIEFLEEASDILPQEYPVYILKGIGYEIKGNYKEAIKSFDEGLKINSDCADLWYYKGETLATMREYSKAFECLDKAIALEPENDRYTKGKSRILNKAGIISI
ncbi:tetratricopeptide repeat protein [Candidatus Woesearchaeota archaeon]|nr:tetratricopeptide repeat protein [Candidatus Woesearchaeota archaeon]